ncbi:MAG: hypothetical protein IT338_11290 [Thermomicrobiales bacterium]|nr:hypothetical protein [Thermomicrobiales bacterium]
MALIVGTLAITLVLLLLAAARVSQIASWRAVAMIARTTGSPRACVAFIRFCAWQQSHH